jgi:hypothetical protein
VTQSFLGQLFSGQLRWCATLFVPVPHLFSRGFGPEQHTKKEKRKGAPQTRGWFVPVIQFSQKA